MFSYNAGSPSSINDTTVTYINKTYSEIVKKRIDFDIYNEDSYSVGIVPSL